MWIPSISNSGRLLLGFGAVPIRRQPRVLVGDGVVGLIRRAFCLLRLTHGPGGTPYAPERRSRPSRKHCTRQEDYVRGPDFRGAPQTGFGESSCCGLWRDLGIPYIDGHREAHSPCTARLDQNLWRQVPVELQVVSPDTFLRMPESASRLSLARLREFRTNEGDKSAGFRQ
jgi:hypothetical protein